MNEMTSGEVKHMTKILIVEDHTMLRESLEHVIGGHDDMEVAGSTGDAAKALELCRKYAPDLVLMDITTKNNFLCLACTEQIRKEFPDIKIVLMAAMPKIIFAEEARKAGAHSFMDKNMENDHLLHVIRYTMKGYSIYSSPSDRLAFYAQFTEKEIAVIRLGCQGATRSEMAKKLGVSESTIKPLVTSILDKTGFDNISKFALYAMSQSA
jgi:DNA-binding NarL/FixJ family response regulator